MRSSMSCLGLVAIAVVYSPGPAWAVKPTAQELTRSSQWLAENFGHGIASQASSPKPGRHAGAVPPFSFVYGGKPFQDLLHTWEFHETAAKVDETRTRRIQTYRDRTSGLTVRCEIVEYRDYPVVEWTLHFKNSGTNDTAIVENIQALDSRFKGPAGNEFLLHHKSHPPRAAVRHHDGRRAAG